jgi:signal transduction histidine kinase
MRDAFAQPGSLFQRLVYAGAAVLATCAVLALALYVRLEVADLPPVSLKEFTAFGFDPYLVGYLFEGVVVPAALIYLLSTTAPFRRVAAGQPQPSDALRLFVGLSIIQLLTLAFDLARFLSGRGEPLQAALGLLVVVAGGLLAGWRLGLGLGLIAFFSRGTLELALMLGSGPLDIYRQGGVPFLLREWPWPALLRDFYLYNMWAWSALWAGLVAGLIGGLLGNRRFAPGVALALGVGFDLGAGYLTTIAGVPPGVFFLIPGMLISGLALPAVALMVHNVQADVARQKAEAAELALARAELRALRAQINPHFFFNALNTIRYFVRTDPQVARRLLVDLSEVFQRALRSGEMVPLRDELGYVQAYLALEKARLGQRLQVEWTLPEFDPPELLDHPVPTLILQPIVENAVVHGVAQKPEGGVVRVAVVCDGGDLLLRVADDGPGIPPGRLARILAPINQGDDAIALRNVDGRLRALYGSRCRLSIDAQEGLGTRVEIRIPLEGKPCTS